MSQPEPADYRLIDNPVWHQLCRHYDEMRTAHMRDLFAAETNRFNRFSLRCNDILLDFSKNIINHTSIELFTQLAQQSSVRDWTERLFQGEEINHTEEQAVLHTALRNRSNTPIVVDGENIMPAIHGQLERMRCISDAIRNRQWRGVNGQPITDVVNIGIGGSDLGPRMVTGALRPYAIHDLKLHFVSNLDENHIWDTLEQLKAETTLFIISSKSFRTQDTILNAETAREWFLKSVNDASALHKHFLAVTANVQAALKFGIKAENILHIWGWVGGRYSLWSAMGLAIAISIGMEHFEALLQGGYEMDQHFRNQPLEKNMPVILAMLGIWYSNFFDSQSYAILPYDEHMHDFPAYLQQADMESNGKYINRSGAAVEYTTGPVIFGEIGIKAQHAFYQLLHQGTRLIPADFLVPVTDFHCIERHHRALMANVFAQTEALMKGRNHDEARAELEQQGYNARQVQKLLPYKLFPGNRPSNTIIFRTLDPKTLGSLIALYEHKIFVQGIIWNINSYDQWGVEYGKQLAGTIRQELNDHQPVSSHDSSTNNLINYYKTIRHEQLTAD